MAFVIDGGNPWSSGPASSGRKDRIMDNDDPLAVKRASLTNRKRRLSYAKIIKPRRVEPGNEPRTRLVSESGHM
jgi:hypothetical protein